MTTAIPDSYLIEDVPYLSQKDNRRNPSGSCNVTSVAMVLMRWGFVGNGNGQFEDQLYQKCFDIGVSRHDAQGLDELIESFPGMRNTLKTNATLEDIKRSIASEKPVILHGYFTRFGHIIVGKGYDRRGLIVNDPWGEYFPSGYDTTRTGESLHYSWSLISRTCSPESERDPRHIWMHSAHRE